MENVAVSSDQTVVEPKPINLSPGAVKLSTWLNQCLRIEMSDGRILIGIFLCTDRDANIILGSCSEYLPEESVDESEASSSGPTDEPRMLGLVMVPGKHIVNISIDENKPSDKVPPEPLTPDGNFDAL